MQIDILAMFLRTINLSFSFSQEDLLYESIPNEEHEPKILTIVTNSFVSNMQVDKMNCLQ